MAPAAAAASGGVGRVWTTPVTAQPFAPGEISANLRPEAEASSSPGGRLFGLREQMATEGRTIAHTGGLLGRCFAPREQPTIVAGQGLAGDGSRCSDAGASGPGVAGR